MNERFKITRAQLKISQQELARRARVSLATVQNIEGGRGNPELSTVLALCQALGLELSATPIHWDDGELVALGLPLLNTGSISPIRGNASHLVQTLNQSVAHLMVFRPGSREEKAMASFLWAIRDHYPSVWIRLDHPLRDWFEELGDTAKSIQLRRLSSQRLSEYL